jgi:monovalent cation:H+ antiporter-2, CPA2 family
MTDNFTIIKDIVIILVVSLPIIFIFNKLKLPSIVGFLVAGMFIGPFGFQFINEIERIEVMAEIGVILLLFTIGLEVSFAKLLEMKKFFLFVGGLQLLTTILISAAIFMIFGVPINKSIFMGMLISLSSTAIVLKLLSDRNELTAPHGKISLAILIFQDLAIVAMFLLLPILSSTGELSISKIIFQFLYAFGALAVIFFAARILMPKILYQLARLKMREAFSVGIILLLLGTAYATHSAGLSFAMGAFVAGLIVSESEYSHQVVAEILPMKHVFNSIFFVSVGLLLNFQFVLEFPQALLVVTLSIIVLKSSIIIILIKLIKYPVRIAIISGLMLAQVGEFSFILAQAGQQVDLIDPQFYNAFLASSIFTMLLTPFLFYLAPRIARRFGSLERVPVQIQNNTPNKLKGHVVIAGFGVNGKNLARVLKETGIKYVVVEMNPDTVKEELRKGENIIYGDITKDEILIHTNIDEANIIVFAISDPASTRIGLKLAKNHNPKIYSIVRTRYLHEIEELMNLGADNVIPEEFETSLQIFSKVLERYHIPLNVIMQQIAILRHESYSLMRKETGDIDAFVHLDEILASGLTETFYVDETNVCADKSLSELNLRAITDATIIAIVRKGKSITNPSGKEILNTKDTVVLTGSHNAVDKAVDYLNRKK